jgi:hypothetical protein
MKVYRAKSVVDEFLHKGKVYSGVTISWECRDREGALADYSEAIQGFGELGTEQAAAAIADLNMCFSLEEVQALRAYLEQAESEILIPRLLEAEELLLPIPPPPAQWLDFIQGRRDEAISLEQVGADEGALRSSDQLSGLRIVGLYYLNDNEPEGFAIHDRDHDLIGRFSATLASELGVAPEMVSAGVTTMWKEQGFSIQDRTLPTTDDLPF